MSGRPRDMDRYHSQPTRPRAGAGQALNRKPRQPRRPSPPTRAPQPAKSKSCVLVLACWAASIAAAGALVHLHL